MLKYRIFVLIVIAISVCDCNEQEFNDSFIAEHPYNFVNPFIGTGGEGHTYPGATVPFGMVQLSPDTDIKHYSKSFPWCAGYQYRDSSIIGFSHTHFSGTGHSDMGDVLMMPTQGKLQLIPGPKEKPDEGYRSRFSHNNESAEPGYYQVLLKDYDINVELTASRRAGFHKYTFNKEGEAFIILDLIQSIYNYDEKVTWASVKVENNTLITGYRQTKGWAPDRKIFYAIKFSKPFKNYGIKKFDDIEYKGFGPKENYLINYPEGEGKKLAAHFDFDVKERETIFIKVGISAIDKQGALNNLESEISHWNFDKVRLEARELWEKELSKIIIEGSKEQKENFYTAVYHTMLAPTIYSDVDNRYRGADNNIHNANGFTNYTLYSLWDTYRAVHPLFTMMHPDRVSDMINSMIMHQQQSVHRILPVWAFHANETWCMIGYHAVSVIADAFIKAITDYSADEAFEAVKQSATYPAYDGLDAYMEYGFVPIDLEHEGASKTLEYAYDDWAIAQMAKKMGKTEDYNYFIKRAGNFINIFDQETRFMRAKKSNGEWREPFDPLYAQYGGDYTEGNAWQYSWYVPHDPAKLIDLMGGKDIFIQHLDSLFIIKADEEKFKHVEDIAGLIGQYAHGNEPSHHIAYLYNYAGVPWKTQYRIHQVMNNLFDNTPYGIPGNEDCGQMSSWYIFSSLGFYPVCPGSNQYVFGSPCIPYARIDLGNNKYFEITAENLNEENIYIQSVKLNGNPYNKLYIDHDDIINSGKLKFIMGPEPVKNITYNSDQLPYSMSVHE